MQKTAWGLFIAAVAVLATVGGGVIEASPPVYSFYAIACGTSDWEYEPSRSRPRWLTSGTLLIEHANALLDAGLGDQIAHDSEYPVFLGGFAGLPFRPIGWVDFEYLELEDIKQVCTELKVPPQVPTPSFGSQLSVSVTLLGTLRPPPIPDHIVRKYKGTHK